MGYDVDSTAVDVSNEVYDIFRSSNAVISGECWVFLLAQTKRLHAARYLRVYTAQHSPPRCSFECSGIITSPPL